MEKDIALAKLNLKQKRAYLRTLDKYDEEHPDILKYRKRTQLTIEECKIRIAILNFELDCLKEERKENVALE
jgi:hypothetical protein